MSGEAVNATGSEPNDLSGWQELRDNSDIQFEPIVFPPREPRDPGWFERFFQWLIDSLNLGEVLVGSWPILKWVLIALLVAAALMLLVRLLDLPMLGNRKADVAGEDDAQWVPNQQESLALLEDADKLAASGQFDEATHLLLQRSVGQIAAARPDWVEPSSTARELSVLSELPQAAREAFGVIAERVERSLFALRSLDQSDWEAARSAYARFAQVPMKGSAW
ncbi:hypothetical protein HUO12_13090 [Altererythrobacter sp. JGD-16]|uniref:DUF4129 domain-containing protein n=1 Tax=Altererythrobacter lutimaris TaxID=2743979 RepID=A0A850H9J5_9SPHN|nr:hypothetical protein [Altererythrobacter lutimaris]